jgi:hypothetical protein
MRSVFVLSALLLAAPALAQEGDNARGKATPQEEAMWSCTTQVENQKLPSDEQKKQWMMACLTGATGTGPTPRAVDAQTQEKICKEQHDELELTGGEGENFLTACRARNEALLREGGAPR